MFHLSVVDHIRLSFATVAAAYQRHADAASRLDRLSWYVKIVLVTLTGLACVLALVALQRGRGFQIAAAVTAGVAFVGVRSLCRPGSRAADLRASLDCGPFLAAHREVSRAAG